MRYRLSKYVINTFNVIPTDVFVVNDRIQSKWTRVTERVRFRRKKKRSPHHNINEDRGHHKITDINRYKLFRCASEWIPCMRNICKNHVTVTQTVDIKLFFFIHHSLRLCCYCCCFMVVVCFDRASFNCCALFSFMIF